MKAPSVGDRVKLSHDASGSALFGIVYAGPSGTPLLDVGGMRVGMDRSGWTATVLQPDEPDVWSVVLDRNGDAWQGRTRQDGLPGLLWVAAARGHVARPWSELVDDFGPLRPMVAA